MTMSIPRRFGGFSWRMDVISSPGRIWVAVANDEGSRSKFPNAKLAGHQSFFPGWQPELEPFSLCQLNGK